MKVLATVAEALAQSQAGLPRVLVPTMGALHKAHLELIRVARDCAGRGGEVAVSIFVNPLQFDPGSDYQRYPRPDRQDEELCRNADVDLLFRPSPTEMYADDRSVFVEECSLSNTLEGKSRPGHFRGVCTVVANLNEGAVILRNVAPAEGRHWLGIELKGKEHRDVVGARIILEAGGAKQYRFAKGGGSYASSPDRRHVFGLDKTDKIDRVTVEWPGGKTQEWTDLAVDKYHKLVEK